MIVWKVVNKDNTSVAVDKIAEVLYKIGISVKAPKWLAKEGFHLFAFKTLKDAKDFMCYKDEIYKAEAKKTTQKLPLFLDYFILGQGKMRKRYCDFPQGTVMCKEITLLEKVT